jgi:hypothetical protein
VTPTVKTPLVCRCWSKKAKQVWENGRLIPWEEGMELKKREEGGFEKAA